MKTLLSILMIVAATACSGQKKADYIIETSDITNFWIAFDSIKNTSEKAKVLKNSITKRPVRFFQNNLNCPEISKT